MDRQKSISVLILLRVDLITRFILQYLCSLSAIIYGMYKRKPEVERGKAIIYNIIQANCILKAFGQFS